MKQLFGKAVTARRFRLSLLAAGLFSLSVSTFAASVTVGGANFTESSILANIYASALKKNHIEANTRLNLGNREIIIPALQSGEIDYCGQTISKMEAHKIIRLGLAQVPEGRRVFSGLTVQQNLQMGAYTRRDGKEAIQNDFDMVFDLLPRLKERRNQPAGTLSGGEQQMLAMGRALMCKPKMLLLDEPSMGLSPLLVKEIFKIIRQVNRNGVTVLLVEQNAKMALEIANRAYVLETGTIKKEGEATELANNIEVRKAYLGCE